MKKMYKNKSTMQHKISCFLCLKPPEEFSYLPPFTMILSWATFTNIKAYNYFPPN